MANDRPLTSVDCGSRICDEEVIFQEVCRIYVDASVPGCTVPCDVQSCEIEIQENVLCPVWSCIDKTTTSTPWTTVAPANFTSSDHCLSSTTCISSLTLNIAFVCFVVAGVVVLIRKRCQRRRNRHALLDAERQSDTTELSFRGASLGLGPAVVVEPLPPVGQLATGQLPASGQLSGASGQLPDSGQLPGSEQAQASGQLGQASGQLGPAEESEVKLEEERGPEPAVLELAKPGQVYPNPFKKMFQRQRQTRPPPVGLDARILAESL